MKTLFAILVAAFSMSCVVAQVSDKDEKFMKAAAEGGILEIELGELAMVKGESAEVKQLGQMMVTDHTKANNQLQSLATGKKVNLPTTLSPKMQKHVDKLSGKKGKDFDVAYSKCMVKSHKKEICKFRKQAKKGQDADVKSFASNTLPTLEHHKMMSENACKALK